jgi:hypothetical protein
MRLKVLPRGEKQNQPFQLSFNASLKVDFQGSRVTSDGGLILVRELDERLGFGELIEQHLTDPRGTNSRLPLADLLRQSVYNRLAGYEDMNDAERLSHDPTFRLIGSEKIWERGAALTSRLQTFETEMLAEEENFGSLARINLELVGKAEAINAKRRILRKPLRVVDILIARDAAVDRLAQQVRQRKPRVLPVPRVGQVLGDEITEAQTFVQLTYRNQAAVGGEPRSLGATIRGRAYALCCGRLSSDSLPEE